MHPYYKEINNYAVEPIRLSHMYIDPHPCNPSFNIHIHGLLTSFSLLRTLLSQLAVRHLYSGYRDRDVKSTAGGERDTDIVIDGEMKPLTIPVYDNGVAPATDFNAA